MKRIIMHWTAGTNKISPIDKEHYHEIVDSAGNREFGNLKPEANLNISDGVYLAHTRGLNTGSIGLAMAGMHNANDRPFSAGNYPLTQTQLNAFVKMVAEYAETYGIPVTRKTILTHAEVQPTLGVAQRGKWDITWLPDMTGPQDPVAVGDRLRAMVMDAMKPTAIPEWFPRPKPKPAPFDLGAFFRNLFKRK